MIQGIKESILEELSAAQKAWLEDNARMKAEGRKAEETKDIINRLKLSDDVIARSVADFEGKYGPGWDVLACEQIWGGQIMIISFVMRNEIDNTPACLAFLSSFRLATTAATEIDATISEWHLEKGFGFDKGSRCYGFGEEFEEPTALRA